MLFSSRNICSATFIVCSVSMLGWAAAFEIGQQVFLHASKAIGVPIHREAKPSFLKHVPDGSIAIVQKISDQHDWLYLALESGDRGWVHPKYVRETFSVAPNPRPQSATFSAELGTDERDVWSSREQCETTVSAGRRMVSPSTPALRVATWNLRWFPYGLPPDQHGSTRNRTDVSWLACTIAWMQVDVVAVQESLATRATNQAWDTLIQRLHALTGDSWEWSPQPCGEPDGHHIGFLWNKNRVILSGIRSLWPFNVKAASAATACEGGLRPGHYAYVRSREKDGADFHLIGLHLKSGPTVFALEDRQKALNRIDKTVAPLLDQDRDVVIVGDFNTMGAGDTASRKSELKYVRRMVSKENPGFQDLPITPQCTHYFRGKGGWLDHVLVSSGMKEVTAASAQVTGYCALSNCQKIPGKYPPAYRHLSDHCPVILEIQDRDED